jgi:hypothetical protein
VFHRDCPAHLTERRVDFIAVELEQRREERRGLGGLHDLGLEAVGQPRLDDVAALGARVLAALDGGAADALPDPGRTGLGTVREEWL